jgi:hypothetical protein
MGFFVFSLRSSCLAIAPLSFHKTLPPPPAPPAPFIWPHGEVFGLPLRYGWMFAEISADVEYEGWGFGAVKLDHDMGFLIPHICYGPPSVLLAAHIAFSKCKVMFGKATVKINNKQAGWWFPVIAMFQVCDQPCALPLGFDISAIWTTVKYGFSLGDWICGLLRIAVDSLLSFLLDKLFEVHFIENLLGDWALRAAFKLYPFLGKVLFPFIGFYNFAVIQKVMEKLLPAIIDKARELGLDYAGEEGMEELSRYIDEQVERLFGDEPPVEPPESAIAPVLKAIPMAP